MYQFSTWVWVGQQLGLGGNNWVKGQQLGSGWQ